MRSCSDIPVGQTWVPFIRGAIRTENCQSIPRSNSEGTTYSLAGSHSYFPARFSKARYGVNLLDDFVLPHP